MKKLAGALLVVLMIAAGLLFSASPASAQDETEDETQGEIEQTQTTEGESSAGLSSASDAYLEQVYEWARRGAEAGRDELQSQIDTAVEELQERLQTLEGRLEVREGAQWLPEFCLRWMTELNKSNAIVEMITNPAGGETNLAGGETNPAGGEGGGTSNLTRSLAGQLLKSRVGAMLILIVNGVELCALKVDLR